MNDFDLFMAKERQRELIQDAQRIQNTKYLQKQSFPVKPRAVSHILSIIFHQGLGNLKK